MNVYEAIINRRSVRQFTADPVPDSIVEKLLTAAHRAPSAGNIQPWFFYLVKNQAKREELARAALGQRFIATSPLCIVVCAEPDLSASVYRRRGAELYCIQDTAAAIQNLLLASLEHGLGTCWIGAFNEEQVNQILGIPSGRRPVALVPVGYPANKAEVATSRKKLDEVSSWI